MSVFGNYAAYYDLLYKDKDYPGEAAYVDALIQRFRSGAKTILELGSGTGRHALSLARKGYRVFGVERSAGMLLHARRLVRGTRGLRLTRGDIRDVRLRRRFDAVISLFHVMSYQAANEDLRAAFRTVERHLRRGGVFVFDAWYGPAVMTERPAARVKRVSDDTLELTRVTETEWRPNENAVDVKFHLFIRDKTTGGMRENRETHRLRYLFKPEIEALLGIEGLRLVHAEEWMTGRELGIGTFGACFVAVRD